MYSLTWYFFYWVVVLFLITAGIFKLWDPFLYLPIQSFLPVTSELFLFISALPLSIYELLLAFYLIFKSHSPLPYKFLIGTFLIYFFWSFIVLVLNIEVSNACIERMATRQNQILLIAKNLILLLISVYLMKTKI